MTEPDHELAGRIAGYLKEGVRDLDPAVADRLLAARKVALSRYQGEKQPAWSWAWAAQAVGRRTGPRQAGALQMVAAGAALVAAVIGFTYWQNYNGQASELAEVDAGLLTDELPIDAYLDKGFDSWLKRSSR
jgi:hypothetical protein